MYRKEQKGECDILCTNSKVYPPHHAIPTCQIAARMCTKIQSNLLAVPSLTDDLSIPNVP